MRQYNGISPGSLPATNAPDFTPRLRSMLSDIDAYLHDTAVGFQRIIVNEYPAGSGATLGVTDHGLLSGLLDDDHTQYLLMSGRTAGEQITSQGYWDLSQPVADSAAVLQLHAHASSASSNLFEALNPSAVLVASLSHQGALFSSGYTCGSLTINASGEVVDAIPMIASGSGNQATFDVSTVGSGQIYSLPGTGGTLLSTNNSATVSSKTMATSTNIRCNTGTGTTFQDNSTTTKQMRLDLSGISASSTRNLKIQDTAGSAVVVGNTTSAAGVLGKSDLTGQGTSIGATTLLTGGTATAGMYRVCAYLKTTTAGVGGDIVTMTVAYNDGAAQTIGMPFVTTGGVATNHDLATLNAYSQGSVVVNAAASQNITYSTTLTKGASNPQHEIHVRIELLG